MKESMTLVQMAQEIERQEAVKKDFIASETSMIARTVPDDGGARTVVVEIGNEGEFTINDHAHKQIATHLKIPGRYYGRMIDEAPELLATNVNHWLQRNDGSQRLVRTLDGRVRGFLSNRYRPLDNGDFAEIALATLHNDIEGEIEIKSGHIDETRMYLKAVCPRMQGEVKVGDVVQCGICLRNSEVGDGALQIDPLVYRLICLNGAVRPLNLGSYSRRHVGARHISQLDVEQFMSDEAREADDRAFWLGVRDVIRAVFDPESLQRIIEQYQAASNRAIIAPINETVQATVRRYKLPESMQTGILEALLRGDEGLPQDYSQYGLANALTRYSQSIESYHTATDLETLGATIMAEDDRGWKSLMNLATALAG